MIAWSEPRNLRFQRVVELTQQDTQLKELYDKCGSSVTVPRIFD